MQVPERLNINQLKGLEWKLPNLEENTVIDVPESSKIYIDRNNKTTQ